MSSRERCDEKGLSVGSLSAIKRASICHVGKLNPLVANETPSGGERVIYRVYFLRTSSRSTVCAMLLRSVQRLAVSRGIYSTLTGRFKDITVV